MEELLKLIKSLGGGNLFMNDRGCGYIEDPRTQEVKLSWSSLDDLKGCSNEAEEADLFDGLPRLELDHLGDCSLEIFTDSSCLLHFPDGSIEEFTLREAAEYLKSLQEVEDERQNNEVLSSEINRLRSKLINGES